MSEKKICVTTSREAGEHLRKAASDLARVLEARRVPRRERSLERIAEEEGADIVVVVGGDRITCYAEGEKFFFHPSMAKNRIRALRQGQRDPMVEAMGLRPGMSVLDATLGRAADACVAAHVVGEEGRVVGLEVVPLIAHLTRLGLREFETDSKALAAAMRRVEVVLADHAEYLAAARKNSFDVVYFDPFFPETIPGAQAIQPLRVIGRHGMPTEETIAHAARVARRRVVVKLRRDLPPPSWAEKWEAVGGKKSRVVYRVLRVGEDGGGEGE